MEQQRKSELLQEVRSLQKTIKDCRNPNQVKRIEVYVSLVQLELELDPVNPNQELTFTQPTKPANPTTLTFKKKKEEVPSKKAESVKPPKKQQVDQPEQKRGRGRPRKEVSATNLKVRKDAKWRIEFTDPHHPPQYVSIGSNVLFKNVLGTVEKGVVQALNEPNHITSNGNTFNCRTVTIQSQSGSFDRPLNQIK